MPGADAGVLVMVHAGRENARAVDQLQSVATLRGQFSWKSDEVVWNKIRTKAVLGVWGGDGASGVRWVLQTHCAEVHHQKPW
jgi:hypothetical protein